jgi:hypothetical protein
MKRIVSLFGLVCWTATANNLTHYSFIPEGQNFIGALTGSLSVSDAMQPDMQILGGSFVITIPGSSTQTFSFPAINAPGSSFFDEFVPGHYLLAWDSYSGTLPNGTGYELELLNETTYFDVFWLRVGGPLGLTRAFYGYYSLDGSVPEAWPSWIALAVPTLFLFRWRKTQRCC